MKIKIVCTLSLLLIIFSCSIRTAPKKEEYIGDYYFKEQKEKVILKITKGDRYHLKLEGFGDVRGKIIEYFFNFDLGASIQLDCKEKDQNMRLRKIGIHTYELVYFNDDAVKVYLKKSR